ncbi:FG-GAP-like repeat-containing protein [Streptomyces sp. NPDC056160]|uniref:FG-GAP-like repeat-containing protein n=1 Tax=Streptomyces sp. NPDC056160 TaxID=3345731 RepID=UPI0035DDF156
MTVTSTQQALSVGHIRRVATSVAVVGVISAAALLSAPTATAQPSPGAALPVAPVSADAGLTDRPGATTAGPAKPYDFNGDGYQDLATGGPHGTVGAVEVAGYVAVVYGSASGLNTAKRQVISQDSPGVPGAAETGDGFGWDLTSADFDCDGYADLAVSAPFEKLDVSNAGLVTVIFGSPSGLSSSSVGLSIPAGQQDAHDYFGDGMAAGDFNRDGRPELVVTAEGKRSYFTYSFNASRAAVPGPVAKAPQNRLMDIAAGDVDGDGYADLATVTDDYEGPSSTDVRVFRGGAGGLATSPAAVVTAGEWRGLAWLALGDVNGDKHADVILGDNYAPVNGVDSAGRVVRLLRRRRWYLGLPQHRHQSGQRGCRGRAREGRRLRVRRGGRRHQQRRFRGRGRRRRR